MITPVNSCKIKFSNNLSDTPNEKKKREKTNLVMAWGALGCITGAFLIWDTNKDRFVSSQNLKQTAKKII